MKFNFTTATQYQVSPEMTQDNSAEINERTDSMPPSLHVVVAGTVTHGKPAQQAHPTSSKAVDEQPRVFHQTFILSPDTESDDNGHVKYYITTDNMRFVG